MYRESRAKVSLEKIPEIADAIGANRAGLMDRALREYLPEVVEAYMRCHSGPTDNELAIIDLIRQFSGGSDPGTDDYGVREGLERLFAKTAQR
jgi:hypothetical protein